jgi:isopentenyl diphosphate isomerase/L-lactate dehydrogenase-like FMN-dependent dehydrogenase
VTAFKYQLSSKPGPITVEDYRVLARRAVPDMVWAYVDYGAEDLQTLQANRRSFSRYSLRARVLTGNQGSDLAVTVGRQTVSLPVLLAPTGLVGLSHWKGELGAAQAAERAGTLSILSTASSYTLEEVAAGTDRDHFFQLYPRGRSEVTESLIRRARQAGYQAMFVTVDVQARGNRESERKRGMGNPPVITPRRVLDGAIRPRWWTAFVRHRRFSGRNLVDAAGARAAVASLTAQEQLLRPQLTWDDFKWMRDQWDRPLYIKGVLDADDAEIAVDLGADGVVVSNHGGRQLDGAVAALDALPAIVARVGDRAEVLIDGGVRRGADVIKALCLGADAVCIGRPYVYGMAARGPAGVEHVIEIFREEISRAMTLMGVRSVKELDSSWLLPADTPLTG